MSFYKHFFPQVPSLRLLPQKAECVINPELASVLEEGMGFLEPFQ